MQQLKKNMQQRRREYMKGVTKGQRNGTMQHSIVCSKLSSQNRSARLKCIQ